MKKFLYFLAAALIQIILRIFYWTLRFKVTNPQNIEQAQKAGGVYLLATWHKNIPSCILGQMGQTHLALVSRSNDGELVAKNLEWFGHKVVRGSSGKGATSALMEVIKAISEYQLPCAISVDGPKGPAKVPKSGIIHMAKTLQIPIIPYTAIADRVWCFHKSWDKLLFPKPWSNNYVIYGSPYWINKNLGNEELKLELEKLTQVLEEQETMAFKLINEKNTQR